MYQTGLFVPFNDPLYKGIVMVPCAASTVPVLSSCTGPTRLGLTVEGEGPKYDSGTDAPTEGGAGNKSQPGPGPIGPGPGPCSELKDEEDPAELTAGSLVAAGPAVEVLVCECTGLVSAESGVLSA